MDHKKSFIKGALSGALIMLLIVILGSGVWKAVSVRMAGGEAEAAQISEESETDKKLNMLSNVIDQYYLYGDDIDEKAMQDGIYNGYASGLGDPYTVYYNEEQTRDLLESTTGEYSGIGATLLQNYQTRQVTIGNIYKDSPAEEAGLKTGDILYQVDDHVIDKEDLSEIVSWIKGEEGTEVALHVYRGENAEEVVCTATRRKIETQTVEYEMKEDQIGYLRILEFDTVTLKQFENALTDLENQGMKGLVIDLRSNPGGNLDTVVDMLRMILPEGTIVSTKDKDGNVIEEKNEEDHEFKKPLAVLVNQASASASEIFAGAVQDYGVGKIVGMTTYGKGVVQQLVNLGDGTCLKVTIAEYFTAAGRSINKKGITPDVEVEYVADPDHEDADNQLDKAIEVVTGGL
ncbi:S41 family peptidase [Eubacterium sp. am_0171]|uniref:S41 family peptidase n=1 Tax=unclassified Eubacterium (in: firmicutes) TaxID=2624479 RepID=UPI00101F4116|nr:MULTISPECIES: S41 family peptidase [unclassified Eubacterium (in: firmicutes)]MSC82767.1 PDZ domain-containing protein [Eubacterium sp. BIOML-A1]MSD05161.1 PDZ domain-containing protein [Eubacterium sp. BIOML-A2]RYT25057.1 S41 family peptidase [Eubacterium sp. am_0171]